MQEATIVRWLKTEGAQVKRGEPLVEVESAKVNDVVEAPATGTLFRVVVAEGETVPVQTVLGEIEPEAQC